MPSALDIIRAHYAASDKGDIDGMMAPLAPNAQWTEMAGFPYGGTYVGPDAVRANVFEKINAEWDGYRAELTEFVADDQHVVAVGTYSGTYKATGRPFTARVAHYWTLEHGKVVRFEQFTDTRLVAEATGPRRVE